MTSTTRLTRRLFNESHIVVIESDADHAQAKALVEKLLGSDDPADLARMAAQARLIEAYERVRWPRRIPSLPDFADLPDGPARPFAALISCRSWELQVE